MWIITGSQVCKHNTCRCARPNEQFSDHKRIWLLRLVAFIYVVCFGAFCWHCQKKKNGASPFFYMHYQTHRNSITSEGYRAYHAPRPSTQHCLTLAVMPQTMIIVCVHKYCVTLGLNSVSFKTMFIISLWKSNERERERASLNLINTHISSLCFVCFKTL